MRRNFDNDLKCLMHFDFPCYDEHNPLLRDEIGNLNFKKYGYADTSYRAYGEHSPRDNTASSTKNLAPKFGIYAHNVDTESWLKALNHDNLLNVDPEESYTYGMYVYFYSSQPEGPEYCEYNGASYTTFKQISAAACSNADTNLEDYTETYESVCNDYDCLPCSVHSIEELMFLYDNVAYLGHTTGSGSSKRYLISLGGVYDYDNENFYWLDGSPVDFGYAERPESDAFFYAMMSRDEVPTEEFGIFGGTSSTSTNIVKARVVKWPYLIRDKGIINLGGKFFLRIVDNKLKLEVPAWGIDEAGENDITTEYAGDWNYLSMKIHDGYIKIYVGGVLEISAAIPVNASEIIPDFIILGGYHGMIDEFSYRQSASAEIPTAPASPISGYVNCASLNNFGNGTDGDISIYTENILNSSTIITGINNNVLSVNNWSSGLFGAEADREVMIHITRRKDPAYYETNADNYETVNAAERIGGYEFARISSVDTENHTVTLKNFENELNINATLLSNYYVQIITIPNFKNVHIESSGVIKPNKFNVTTGGGIVIIKCSENFVNEGKILSLGYGTPRIDLLEMSHGDLIDRFVIGSGGGIFLMCAGAFITKNDSRIGAEYSGLGEDSNGGSGFGGGFEYVCIGSAGSTGINARLGFDGAEYNGNAGGYGGASVIIMGGSVNIESGNISTGGQVGTSGSGGGGSGLKYVSEKI